MALFSLIATHSDLDLETIASISSGAAEVAASAACASVTLATCNRLEIYAETVDDSPEAVERARDELLEILTVNSQLPAATVEAALNTLHGHDAITHLFEVASGLDSAVIGEREITGQVRRALTQAQYSGSVSGSLTKLFEHASRAAKDVGSKTTLGSRGRSIVSVALDIAGDLHGDAEAFFSQANVLLIGTGAYAGTTLAQLDARSVPNIGVFSGSGRAQEFVEHRDTRAVPVAMEDLGAAFAAADMVIGCSGGSRKITAGEVRTLGRLAQRENSLTLVDLALSHDFSSDVADLPGVDMITLESVKMAAPGETEDSVSQAKAVVAESVDQYVTQRHQRNADDAIVALRKHTLGVLDEELERVRSQHGCTAAAEEVEFAVRRIVRKLLHTPTVRARELTAQGRNAEYLQGLEAVYGLSVEQHQDKARSSEPRRRRAEEFSSEELHDMARYLEQVPRGGFCRHHSAGEFNVSRHAALSHQLTGRANTAVDSAQTNYRHSA